MKEAHPSWAAAEVAAAAQQEFEAAALEFFIETLRVCKEVRPNAKWVRTCKPTVMTMTVCTHFNFNMCAAASSPFPHHSLFGDKHNKINSAVFQGYYGFPNAVFYPCDSAGCGYLSASDGPKQRTQNDKLQPLWWGPP